MQRMGDVRVQQESATRLKEIVPLSLYPVLMMILLLFEVHLLLPSRLLSLRHY